MLSKFEAREIKNAKEILDKDFQTASTMQKLLKEKQEKKVQKKSLWSRVKVYLGQLF